MGIPWGKILFIRVFTPQIHMCFVFAPAVTLDLIEKKWKYLNLVKEVLTPEVFHPDIFYHVGGVSTPIEMMGRAAFLSVYKDVDKTRLKDTCLKLIKSVMFDLLDSTDIVVDGVDLTTFVVNCLQSTNFRRIFTEI
jgi:hypothetical protein